MFPTGLVGSALLALRCSIATILLINAADTWTRTASAAPVIVLIVGATALCLGLLTPCLAVASSTWEVGVLVLIGGDKFRIMTAVVGCVIVSILGPGAYSIDSRIFGRKLLEIPE